MELIKLYMGILFTICLIVCLNSNPKITKYHTLTTPKTLETCPLGLKVCDFKGKVRVSNVMKFTPAYNSGIEEGDRILEINGIKIKDVKEYQKALQNATKENIYTFTVYRVDSCSKFSVEIPNTPFSGDISESWIYSWFYANLLV